jgi:hypothetical protein
MTQYFQFIRGYGPLATGVHLLPVAISVGVGSVVGTQVAVRAGTKLVVTAGLVAMAGFYGWVSAVTTGTISYGIIAVQMVVYGLGMGLTSAPATESIMGAISRRQAGIGSAVNDTTRLLGGTLGVAVIGSVFASLYSSRLTAGMPAGLPGQVSAVAHQSVGAALGVSAEVAAAGHPAAAAALRDAATAAFLHGLSVGCLVAAASRQWRGAGRAVPARAAAAACAGRRCWRWGHTDPRSAISGSHRPLSRERPARSPVSPAARGRVLRKQLVQDVVLPPVNSQQEGRRQAEPGEAVAFEHVLRPSVVRQRPRLDPVQPRLAECQVGDLAYAAGGKAAAVCGGTHPVADVARLERSAHDVVERYPADHLTRSRRV